jgi:hypothetical protein
MATAAARPLPDFLVIGAKRGGSTSLYYALLQHPQVVPLFPRARFLPKANDTKGVHYFDSNYERGPRWYRSYFPSTATRRLISARHRRAVTGEASPYYLFHPLAAARAAALVPHARILLVVRDPVERTFSHYRERVRQGAEPLGFEDALAAESERLAGEEERIASDPTYHSYAHEQQSYRAQSEYAPALRRWLEVYPADRVKVLLSEELYANPGPTLAEATNFLDLDPMPLDRLGHWNAAPIAPMSEPTRRALVEHFAGPNAELESLIGRELPWQRP